MSLHSYPLTKYFSYFLRSSSVIIFLCCFITTPAKAISDSTVNSSEKDIIPDSYASLPGKENVGTFIEIALDQATFHNSFQPLTSGVNLAIESDVPLPRAGSIEPSNVSEPEVTSEEEASGSSTEEQLPRAGSSLPPSDPAISDNSPSEEILTGSTEEQLPRAGSPLPPSDQVIVDNSSGNISDVKPSDRDPVDQRVVNSPSPSTRRQNTVYASPVTTRRANNSQNITQLPFAEVIAHSEPYAKFNKLAYKVELQEVSFLCDSEKSTPSTVLKFKDKDERLVILWNSDFFAEAGYDSDTRCQQVSTRLANFVKEREFLYLTSGKLNGQPALCLTSSEDGSCGDGITLYEGLLFTLKPNDNSQEKLEKLVSLLESDQTDEEILPLNE